jgi:4-hydroxybenzoate polyprenyltransferase
LVSVTESRIPPPHELAARTAGLDGVVMTTHSGTMRGLVKTLRPHQWVKNLFVLAPMVFHKDLFMHTPSGPTFLNLAVTGTALAATVVFCLLAGAVYTINDLVDVEADRVHPVKRERPIARGDVSETAARFMAIGLVVVSLAVSLALSRWFALVALVYFLDNVAYSLKLKHVAFLDVGIIAFGFVLRVLGGGFAEDVRVSGYLIACTALLALFLGFGKRLHEINLENASKQRAALEGYSQGSLKAALFATGVATAGTYIAYTLAPATRAYFSSDRLWLTTPFVVGGILRFMQLVSGRAGRGVKAESPTQEMLRDVPFMLILVLWVLVVLVIIYNVRPA